MADQLNTPEHNQPLESINMGSDRNFGLVFTGLFTIFAVLPLFDSKPITIWALVVGLIFLVVSLVKPSWLYPLNKGWFHFGLLINKIMNPVIMGVLFGVAIIPIALIFKILGKDPLHRKFDKSANSYWVKRAPPGPDPETMKHQF